MCCYCNIKSETSQNKVFDIEKSVTCVKSEMNDNIKGCENFNKVEYECNIVTKSKSEIFLYNKNKMCLECAIDYVKGKKNIRKYLNDYYDENYNEKMLYKCGRLNHARPLYFFIERKKNDYEIRTNCCYCRNYKKVESEEK